MKSGLLLLAGSALLAGLAYTLGLGELAAALRRADPARLGAFLALSTAVFVTFAARWRVVIVAMDPSRPPPGLATLVGWRAAEHAVSTLLPSGHLSGEPVRAFLLRRHGLAWPLAISTVIMDRMLEISAATVIGPAYVMIFFAANERSAWAAPWAMAVMVACIAGLVVFYVHVYRGRLASFLFRGEALRGSLETIQSNMSGFVRSPRFAAGLALAFLAEALVLAELWMLAQAFALPISLPTLVGVMVGMGVAQILPVPGAVGSLEATEVGVLTLAGGSAPLGLAVGLIIRLRETLWILVGLGVLYLEGLSWARLREVGTPSGRASNGTATSAASSPRRDSAG